MTAVGDTSDTEKSVIACGSNFHHDGSAAFKLLEKSPVPPALSAMDLSEERTQGLNVHRIKPINCHPAETDEDSSPESISDTINWINWNGNLDNPKDSEDDCEADIESYTELGISSEISETLQLRNVSAAPNVPGLIRPIPQSKMKVQKGLLTVNMLEMMRNKGIKKK
jgi:hypothetical protein